MRKIGTMRSRLTPPARARARALVSPALIHSIRYACESKSPFAHFDSLSALIIARGRNISDRLVRARARRNSTGKRSGPLRCGTRLNTPNVDRTLFGDEFTTRGCRLGDTYRYHTDIRKTTELWNVLCHNYVGGAGIRLRRKLTATVGNAWEAVKRVHLWSLARVKRRQSQVLLFIPDGNNFTPNAYRRYVRIALRLIIISQCLRKSREA